MATRTRSRRPQSLRRLAAGAAITLALGATSFVPANADTSPTRPELPATVGTKVLPAPQHNGVAWTVKMAGGIAFVGGEFTSARPFDTPPGQQEVPAANFLAFDIATGQLLPHLMVPFNGPIKDIEVSADGTKVYVGGLFTMAGNEPRYRFAAINIERGAVVGPAPVFDYRIEDIAVAGTTIYAGGKFSSMSGQPRQNLAAFTDDGQILPWAPRANKHVLALTASPDGSRVVAGGGFTELSGRPADGWGAIDGVSGASLPWKVNQYAHVSGDWGGITDLDSDDGGVYASAYSWGGNTRFEGTAAANWDGSPRWVKGCFGDSYGVAADGDVLYQVHHTHNCGPIDGIPELKPRIYQRADATTTARSPYNRVNVGYDFNGLPAPEPLHWYPDINYSSYTHQDQGAWAVDAENGYVLLGGEFTVVSSRNAQGIALLASADKGGAEAPAKHWEMNPNYSLGEFGQVKVTIQSLYDRDSKIVHYQLLRDDQVVDQKTLTGVRWWARRGPLTLIDQDPPGGDHVYKVRAVDPDGNAADTPANPVTIPGAAAASEYESLVSGDGAVHMWRLDDQDGDISLDRFGANHLNVTHVTKGVPGALVDEENAAMAFAGDHATPAAASTAETATAAFAAEAWFKTTSTKGGTVMAFGSSRTGTSDTRDRLVYLNDRGNVLFGIASDEVHALQSDETYNDGQWHHVVAQMSQAGQELYVDGERVASDGQVTRGQDFRGYWKIGGESLAGWPDTPRTNALAATIDEVAIYGDALSGDAVRNHYAKGHQAVKHNAAPNASFTVNTHDRDVNLDARGSADTDGQITQYLWDLGDGTTATDPALTHTYEKDGTYTIRLTVTDDRGAEDVRTDTVNVAEGGVIIPPATPGVTQRTAFDDFNRTTARSWGTADDGGVWSNIGAPDDFAAGAGVGVMGLAPGRERTSSLPGVASDAAMLTTDVTVLSPPTGTVYVNYNLRTVGRESYVARVKYYKNGTAQVALLHRNGTAQTVFGAKNVLTGLQPGQTVHIQAAAVGTEETSLGAKIWAAGQPVPADWQVTAKGSAANLAQEGSVGITAYLSSAAGAPLHIATDKFAVADLAAPPAQ